MTAAASYEFVEGATSDLTFVARGASLETLFEAAAEALLGATVDDPEQIRARVRRAVSLEEPELELLLLRFLNELVYLRDAEALLLRAESVRVSRNGGARLVAQLVGEPIDTERHALASEVKAATAHALRVTATPRGWEARVTLDV